MRQFESMLTLYHLLSSRSWSTLQSLHQQCLSLGIECSSDTLRRWLKAWIAAGFVEELDENKEYRYRQSTHQPFISPNQDALLLHWLIRYFALLLPDELRRLLEKRFKQSEKQLQQSHHLQQYLNHIHIELPCLPPYYLSTLTPLKQAMLNHQIIQCVFIGQSVVLVPHTLVLNSQGWWLRYHINASLNNEGSEVNTIHIRSLLCLLWVETR
ncbi:hypothetical protein HC723_10095 [Vibrio sp. S11_S32]|uniref:hypothetical protein n=1 Tax=Vibrio sp. S11_S32 TaxID=2720225 RepID=UPI001680F9A7|nr:hypothetical protein [Vibrio sp. S11_S32]MBD1576786.1 hypothetical protein [Vibrio sp. S11_S32]